MNTQPHVNGVNGSAHPSIPALALSPESCAQLWNKSIRVGATVEVTRDDGSTMTTTTRTPAWVVCGVALVSVRGISGGYALGRVRPV